MSTIKALDLFDAYTKSMLPKEHGYIVSSIFSDTTAYSRYEIVSYNNVKSIYPSEGGLTFQTDGKKVYVLVEPANYPSKSIEPYVRPSNEVVPQRFNELESMICKNQTKVYYSKEALISYGSFTILQPRGANFSIAFYFLPDMYETMRAFFEKTLNKETGIALSDAKKASAGIVEKVEKTMSWDFSAE